MYIAPNSTIYLLGGINWTPAYTDTVYFANKTVQLNYMRGKVKRKFESQSYQRHSKNVLRILASADSLYDCNYLMFQNRFRSGTLGDKWFYAFILDIEYVNENTTDVYYEIDVIQTWFWDLKLGQCFVEREIPRYDTLFGNLVPENLETGELIVGISNRYNMNDTPYYLIQCTTDSSGNPIIGEVNGISCPIHYKKLPITAPPATLKALIEPYYEAPNNPENIINIQIVPANVALAAVPEPGQSGGLTEDEVIVPMSLSLDGYTPKNNKLHTYPYSYLYCTNNSGQATEYKWENFKLNDNLEATFYLLACALGTPTVVSFPMWYRGRDIDYDSGLSMTNFPPVPWVCDTYKAYLAQNKASIMTSILCDAVSTTASLAGGINMAVLGQAINNNAPNSQWLMQLTSEAQRNRGIISSGNSLASGGGSIASTLAKLTDAKAMPKTISTMAQNDMLMLLAERLQFDYYNVSIKKEMAKIIDDYFSAYGYAQHKFKKPEIIARTYWGYTKTKGCELIGSCPEGIKAQIASIFDNGIRFWNSNEIIGDYSLDNSQPRAESEGN